LALPRRAFLLPASLCTCFLAGFILVAIWAVLLVAPDPASCAAANTQYTPGVPFNAGRFLWSWFIDWLRRPFGR